MLLDILRAAGATFTASLGGDAPRGILPPELEGNAQNPTANLVPGSRHLLGGLRMGRSRELDPNRSPTRRADSTTSTTSTERTAACSSTSAGMNPSLTIMALGHWVGVLDPPARGSRGGAAADRREPVRMTRSCAAALAICALFAGPALADANLLGNPGFESGDFTSWTLSGEARPDHSFVSSPNHYPAGTNSSPRRQCVCGARRSRIGGDPVPDVRDDAGRDVHGELPPGSDGETPNQIRVYFSEDGFDEGLLTLVSQVETPVTI
jgi:hypothetical protein